MDSAEKKLFKTSRASVTCLPNNLTYFGKIAKTAAAQPPSNPFDVYTRLSQVARFPIHIPLPSPTTLQQGSCLYSNLFYFGARRSNREFLPRERVIYMKARPIITLQFRVFDLYIHSNALLLLSVLSNSYKQPNDKSARHVASIRTTPKKFSASRVHSTLPRQLCLHISQRAHGT